MDTGLQVYGGPFFQKLKESGGKAFSLIPMPKPGRSSYYSSYTAPTYNASTSNNRSAPVRQRSPSPIDNSTYYNNAGCFGETSSVLVGAEKVITFVKDVRKGDKILTADGLATVLCVVKIARCASKSLVSFPGGLTITKRHPIRVNGEWIQPCKLSTVTIPNPSGYVYNFVLDRSHIPLINGIETCTWGHGLSAEGVKHDYYGSKIIEDLSAMEGWSTGSITITGAKTLLKNGNNMQSAP